MSFAFLGRRWAFVLVVGLALALGACSGNADSVEAIGENAWGLTSANDKVAFDYFISKGLTNFQAAGIVGNLDQESSMNPSAVQSGGPGRGIAQWSVGGRWDSDASDNATWYAGQQGKDVWSLALQLDFIWYELTTFPTFGLATLKATTNVTDATVAFMKDFERCGTCDQTKRVSYAQTTLSAFGADTPGDGGTGTDAGESCVVTTLGVSGNCMSTSACSALPGHVSTPGYCPGPADIQCCTGPDTQDAGQDAAAPDSGSPTPSNDAGTTTGTHPGSGPGAGEDAAAPEHPGDAGGAVVASGHANYQFMDNSNSGCSAAPGGAAGARGGLWLVSIALLALRRKRR